ncbi:MAG: FHA domain-containing protein [Prosthecobacter sp.]|uniref:FHA domain-containing protein n=1 Tax=Prosthecobacter sp. TaxID=1965333 RepID=UPI00390153A8
MSSVQPPPEQPQASLKWSGGALPLSGPCFIGRRSDNDIHINNVQASRRHAVLMSLNDEWWLNDLGSRNGVLVNGLRLTSARRLRHGDEIRIANQRLTFCNARQAPLHRSTMAGKITEVVAEAQRGTPGGVACDLIIVSTLGEVLEGEKAAHWFFGKTLERAPGAAHYALPPLVRSWLAAQLVPDASTAPLEIENHVSRQVVSLARCAEGRCFLLLREESAKISLERLQSLDLTVREAEVMHWVCEGRTNAEIAKDLDVTLHTVNRHVEHIFKKLGVDNRQKAVKHVLERLGA